MLSVTRNPTVIEGVKVSPFAPAPLRHPLTLPFAHQEFELDVRNFLQAQPSPRMTEAVVKIKQEAERQEDEHLNLGGGGGGQRAASEAESVEDVKVGGAEERAEAYAVLD